MNETSLQLNSTVSYKSTDTIVSKKQDATVNHFTNLKNKNYASESVGWQQNTQLGLANRYLVTAGLGKILINDNSHRLLTGAGLSYNLEQSSKSNAETYIHNLEAMGVIQFKKFR